MERTKAYNSNSGNILSYGWQEVPPILEVEFGGRKGGQSAIYKYRGVPLEKWRGLLHAPWGYLHDEIIPNYPVEKVQ
jgi:hypothetical protein